MIGAKWVGNWNGEEVKKKIKAATFESFSQAVGTIRLIAKRSMKKAKGPSSPGSPPNTHTSRLPNAIVYYVDKNAGYAIVGPSFDLIGPVGGAHEGGGMFRGQVYDARPFMQPAMEKITPRLPAMWAASYK